MIGSLSFSDRQNAVRGPMLLFGAGLSLEQCERLFLGSFLRCSFATSDHRHLNCDSFVSDFESHPHHHPHHLEHHHQLEHHQNSRRTEKLLKDATSQPLCSINFEDCCAQISHQDDSVRFLRRQESLKCESSRPSASPLCSPSLFSFAQMNLTLTHYVSPRFAQILCRVRPYFLLTCLIITAYWPSLSADLVFDDRPAIVDNQDLRSDTSWSSLLVNDYWGTPMSSPLSHKSYRPLTVATFRMNFALHELRPFGYHLVNVLLHVLATSLVYRLCGIFFDTSSATSNSTQLSPTTTTTTTTTKSATTRTKRKNSTPTTVPTSLSHQRTSAASSSVSSDASRLSVSFITAALFAVHSIHTDSVSSVVGRAELLSSICYLTAILIVLLPKNSTPTPSPTALRSSTHSKRNSFTSLLKAISIATIGFLCKEQCLFVLPYLAFHQLCPLPASNKSNSRPTPRFMNISTKFKKIPVLNIALLLGAFFTILYFRFSLMNFQFPTFNRFDNPAARAPFPVGQLTFVYVALYHFWLMLYPSTLACDWTHSSIELIDFSSDIFLYDILRTLLVVAVSVFGVCTIFRVICGAFRTTYSTTSTNGNLKVFKCYEQNFTIHENEQNFGWLKTRASAAQRPDESAANGNKCSDFVAEQDSCRRILHAIALVLVPFIPVSNVFFPTGFVVAERVLYLPSIGVALLVGLGIQKLETFVLSFSTHHQQQRRWALSVIVCVMVLLSGMSLKTHLRSIQWQNEHSLYSSGLEVNPRNTKLLNNLGRVYEREHDLLRAVQLYEHAIQIEPNDIRSHLNLGNILVRQNKLTDAEKTYRAAMATAEREIVAVTGEEGQDSSLPSLPDSELATGPVQLADVSVSPLYLTAMLRLAELIDRNTTRRNELEEIRHRMTKLQSLLLRSSSAAVTATTTEANGAHGHESESSDSVGSKTAFLSGSRTASHTHHLNHLYNLAVVHYRQGQHQKSLELFEQVLVKNPDHRESLLASARIIQDRDIDEHNRVAARRLNRLIELGHDDASVYFNLAMLATKLGDDGRASEHFERAINRQPSFIEAHYNLALLLVKRVDQIASNSEKERSMMLAQAEEHLLKALSINPKHSKSMLVLGDLYAEQFMQIEKSRHYYEMVINTIDAGHFRARHNLCVLWHKQHNPAQALKCFETLKTDFTPNFDAHGERQQQQQQQQQQLVNENILRNIQLQIDFLRSESAQQQHHQPQQQQQHELDKPELDSNPRSAVNVHTKNFSNFYSKSSVPDSENFLHSYRLEALSPLQIGQMCHI